MTARAADRLIPVLVACAYLALVAAVQPIGEFPLNDDWSYAWSVKALREEGRLAFTGWVSMPLVAQVLWGWLFTLPAGFSFTAVRLSTVVLAAVAGLAVYAAVRLTTARHGIAAVAALTVLTTPVFFVLSVSFMTDVPGAAAMLVAVLLFLRDLEAPRGRDYGLAVAACLAAVLIRQIALAVPIAYGLAAWHRDGFAPNRLLRAGAPAALGVAVLAGWTLYLERTRGLPELFDLQTRMVLQTFESVQRALLMPVGNLTGFAVMVGLFASPVLVCAAGALWRFLRHGSRSPGLTVAFVVALIAIPLANLAHGLPLLHNVIYDFGLGAPTLKDGFILKLPIAAPAPPLVWAIATAVGVVGAAVLTAIAAASLRRAVRPGRAGLPRPRAATELFLVACLAVYFVPLLFVRSYDRYVIFPTAVACILAATVARAHMPPAGTRRAAAGAVAGLAAAAPLAWFAVAATHDYLAWNRARWSALDVLTGVHGVPPERIDGGFEFNGWHHYGKAPYGGSRPGQSWWWVIDDRFLASFGPLPGYRPVMRAPYRSWLSGGERAILISERAGAPAPVAPAAVPPRPPDDG
ncbi:MAG: glycosyltransferase family 39 protein [Rhodospirillales bacterium]